MPIRLLNERVIGKIAAGEVIERPASVVKELVENSLDAGANRISVSVERGGAELIELVDDGVGISAGDLPLALTRHGTSKLSGWEDLLNLTSLGFRGEALPSIAAVSDFTLRSRTADESVGAELSVVYGTTRPVQPVAAPIGTRVTVRDLFGNVPARRRFLRARATEAAVTTRVVAAYALARPDVAFALTADGRNVFLTDGGDDEIATAVAVWGAEIRDTALSLLPLDDAARVPGIDVRGWIGDPSVTRSHRNNLLFLVNGRWVQSRTLGFALEEAYHSLLMVGRHPIGVIHISVDPATVDVNVHPTKAEVKFVDERAVCRAVVRATHAALVGVRSNTVPEVTFATSTVPTPFTQPMVSSSSSPVTGSLSGSGPSGFFGDHSAAVTSDHAIDDRGHATIEPARSSTRDDNVPVLRVLGQVGGTYIIAEGPDGMYMIDQHAAHERVMYEKILGQIERERMDQQPLLDPLVIELTPEEYAAFERSSAELGQIGFMIEPFGPLTVAVRAVPALIKTSNLAERIRLILSELAQGGTGISWLDAVAISAACHTSIRAGQTLSLEEMRELVAALERTQHPRACGHGRPTMIHVAKGELERQFSRR